MLPIDVADVARAEVRTMQHSIVRFAVSAVLTPVARLVMPVIAKWVLSLATQKCRHQTVTLYGARTGIDNHPCSSQHLDPEDKLRDGLDAIEGKLLSQHHDLTALSMKVRDQSVRGAIVALAAAYEELRDEVSTLSAVIQAHDANVDAIARASAGSRGTAAETVQELDAYLDEAFHK